MASLPDPADLSDGRRNTNTNAGRASPYERTPRSSTTSPAHSPSTQLTKAHIRDALLKSTDGGVTLDLSHLSLTDVGEDGAAELATIDGEERAEVDSLVVRIALGNNRLATLPSTFALLSRLRYLNLRSNSFSVFPAVLTQMPALEILDIRRNKIKRFPAQPGNLINLRVLSISRNKITRLPTYLSDFHQLDTLAIEQNPIEWPPSSVLDAPAGLADKRSMREWVKKIKKWLEENALSQERKFSDDSMNDFGSGANGFRYDNLLGVNGYDHEPNGNGTPHARTFSVSSDMSAYSATSEHSPTDGSWPPSVPSSARAQRPLNLQLNTVATPSFLSSAHGSPSHSPNSYLPTPAESVASTDEEFTVGRSDRDSQQHLRNASYAGGRSQPGHLFNKKSLPDLRTVKAARSRPEIVNDFGVPSPVSQRQDTSSSDASASGAGPSRTTTSGTVKPFAEGPLSASPTSTHSPARTVDGERNAYFRRFSTLNQSAVSKTVPSALIALVEGARAVLYATTQLHQTVIHHASHMTDERLGSVLKTILDPSFRYIEQLIVALDRFDTLSTKRTMPPPVVCRGLVESCKDCVVVFNRVVKALAVQVKVIVAHDDPLYIRSLLLQIWGASAEMSGAWARMAPALEGVQAFLRENRPPTTLHPHPHPHPGPHPHSHLGSASASTSASSSDAEDLLANEFQSPPHVRRTRAGTAVVTGVGGERAAKARRHAGSFSAQDLEIGRTMPSHEPPLPLMPYISGITSALPGQPAFNTQMFRSPPQPQRKMSARPGDAIGPDGASPPTTLQSSVRSEAPPNSLATPPRVPPAMPSLSHSRESSLASLSASVSASSSPLLSARVPTFAASRASTAMDGDAIAAMQKAVDAAPPVWEMMDDIFSNGSSGPPPDVPEALARAKAVTDSFKESIRAVQEEGVGCVGEKERAALREDAHVFLKAVVQLSNFMKTCDGARIPASVVRGKMVKLTNATEEFVILLHASSFSPAPAQRPHSPAVSSILRMMDDSPASATGTPSIPGAAMPKGFGPGLSAEAGANTNGGGLLGPGTGLSRSRSANVSISKLAPAPPAGPRSAAPHQNTFRFAPGPVPRV